MVYFKRHFEMNSALNEYEFIRGNLNHIPELESPLIRIFLSSAQPGLNTNVFTNKFLN